MSAVLFSGGTIPGRARSIDLAGNSPPLWLRPAYCFASLIVWTENRNVTIPDRFICFILTVKQLAALAACVLKATTKKAKNAPQRKFWLRPWLWVTWLEDFLPRNGMAPLLRWCRHWSCVHVASYKYRFTRICTFAYTLLFRVQLPQVQTKRW